MSVIVDLTLDDSEDSTGDCTDGLAQSFNYDQDEIGCVPKSPAESIDSRDEIYSLEDIMSPPNFEEFIQLRTNIKSNEGSIESAVHPDSEITAIEPESAARDDKDIDENEPESAVENDSDVENEIKLIAEDNSEIITIGAELATEDDSDVEDDPELIEGDDSDVEDESEFVDEDDSHVVEIEPENDSDVLESGQEDGTPDCTLADQRLYNCTFCDFSTEVEEWFHKHIESHAPDSKPYVRVYCPDCTYSTGGLKFLFFHMLRIHNVSEPSFYRIGEKRYRCHHCNISVELRIDIENHVSKHLLELKKRDRELRLKYMCPFAKCRFSSEEVDILPRHIKKSHNIAHPTCYRERNQYRLFYHCFKCSFVSPYIKKINEHSRKHYSEYELMQPHRYLCPSKSCKFSSGKDHKITRHLKSKHSAGRAYYRVDSTTFKCFKCGVRKNTSGGMVAHCRRKHRKKKRRIENRE